MVQMKHQQDMKKPSSTFGPKPQQSQDISSRILGSFSKKGIYTSVVTSPKNSNKTASDIKDHFTILHATTKGHIQQVNQMIQEYKKLEPVDSLCLEYESNISELFSLIRKQSNEMKSISDDMNTAQSCKNYSPRIVDDAKTFSLSVEGVQVSLRKLQIEYHNYLNEKQREDLLSLSTSPFDEENGARRRRREGAGNIASGTTESLMQAQKVLYETVERSSLTLDQLAQTSLSIQSNSDELKDQSVAVGTSRKLLTKYGRREWTDKVLIVLALCFFFACVLYIAQKRIF